MQKLPWKTFTASSSYKLSSRQAISAVDLLSFAFFFLRTQGEGDRQTQIKIWQIFIYFLNSCTWNYFASFAKASKCFQILSGDTESVTSKTVFTYSHLNTPIDQWERACYLKYFISSYGASRSFKCAGRFSQIERRETGTDNRAKGRQAVYNYLHL